MKSLVHYELEGLLQQGPHAVWIRLGCFDSFEAAQAAASRPFRGRPVVDSRVTPLFRDATGGYPVELHAAHDHQTLLRPHRAPQKRPYADFNSTLA